MELFKIVKVEERDYTRLYIVDKSNNPSVRSVKDIATTLRPFRSVVPVVVEQKPIYLCRKYHNGDVVVSPCLLYIEDNGTVHIGFKGGEGSFSGLTKEWVKTLLTSGRNSRLGAHNITQHFFTSAEGCAEYAYSLLLRDLVAKNAERTEEMLKARQCIAELAPFFHLDEPATHGHMTATINGRGHGARVNLSDIVIDY